MDPSQIVNGPLWDRARWTGVAFGHDPGRVPWMALVFTNGTPGRQIFREWRELVGAVDADELIRVSIVEGVIPGDADGYVVHIGPNVTAGAVADGAATFTTRFHRINPAPGSPHLAGFKSEFGRQGRYYLICATFGSGGELLLAHESQIQKSAVSIRHVSEIGANGDLDRAVLIEEARERPH